MKMVNLTPHDINVVVDETTITIPKSGTVARVTSTQTEVGTINGIPVVKTVFGAVEGLPEPEMDTIYVVSSLVLAQLERADVVAPDTGPTALRENGQIVAVRRFQM